MTASGSQFLVSSQPVVKIDGQAIGGMSQGCFRLETMEDDTGLASLEAVFLNLDRQEPGKPVDFLYFDRKVVDFGKRIEIGFDAGKGLKAVFQGVITAIGGDYPEAREPELILHAEDALAQARMRRRTRVFENATDGDIVRQVAGDAGLSPDVQIDGPSHVQHWQVNQSDLALLRERVDAQDGLMTVHDRDFAAGDRAAAADPPIKLTNYNELHRFSVMADLAHQRAKVRVHGWDVAGKQAIHGVAEASEVKSIAAGGGRTGPEILAEIWPDAAEDLHLEMPATSDEADGLAKAHMRRRARAFVRGRGTATGNPDLKVGVRVELLDLGPFFTGVYQLTSVRHCFDMASGYRTLFEASRAALGEGS